VGYWWELRPCSYYSDFEKAKIIYPNICTQPEFAYDTEGYYSNQKTFIIPSADIYLLAILNSSIIKLIFESTFPKLRGGFFEPSYVFMKDVPICRINFTTPSEERTYYLEKARNLYEYCLSKDDQICVLGFVEHHLSKEPEESDVVHDLLAFLAEEMIRLNKAKQAEQKGFLGWLETSLKILPDKDGKKGIDVLTGKGKISNYPGDYQKGESALGFEELLDILRKNKSKLGISLNDTRLVERLRSTYAASLEKVLPLKERLARTDALIDQVVYRLYGLTEEEIAVVEGRG
jgi:hypothetical protein